MREPAGIEGAIAGIRTRFLGRLHGHRDALAALGEAAQNATPDVVEAAIFAAHKIAGSARMLGLPTLGEVAFQTEVQLTDDRDNGLAPGSGSLTQAEALIAEIDAALAGHSG
ncbi:MAG: Hpt domain-containing protein [Paracoccaceae bacterium]